MFMKNRHNLRPGGQGLQERHNSVNISSMNGRSFCSDQRGSTNILLIPLILAGVILVAAIAFGAWAFSGREDYRTNVATKIAAAVTIAKQDEDIAKDKEHAEADKQPLRPYKGAEQYGGVQVLFPKTWSAYVADSGPSNQPVDGYFHPNIVPNISDRDSAFALRVQVINRSYASAITGMNSLVATKKVTAVPYAFPKVPSVVGTKFDGAIMSGRNITGSLVIIPIRDKTLEVWTESPLYVADFNSYILPNITFSP